MLRDALWIVVIVFTPWAIYGVALIASKAFFKAKMSYQRELMKELEGGRENGKSNEEQG